MNIMVLGIGNLVMSDDGIGVRVVQLIAERYRLPGNATVVDGGTSCFDLLPEIESADRLIIVDAVDTGAAPGTVVRLTGAISRWHWRPGCRRTRSASRTC